MVDIVPFQIKVPDSEIIDLTKRLEFAKFPKDELEGAGWHYGTPLADVKRLTAYWLNEYDWRKEEERLNQLPQFTTHIQCENFESLNVHFLYWKSHVGGAIPLLFMHGWPGSFIEVLKIIKELPQGNETRPAFDVVAPSLPNYGFSGGSKKKGFSIEQYSETCHKLMLKLGYKQYVTQGGDLGMIIGRTMSIMYPGHCVATHLNMDSEGKPTWTSHPLLAAKHAITPYTERERKGVARTQWFAKEGSGYRAEHSTKPQTIGYALADSPVALLAWVYEKLHDWTDSYPWTEDEICTWLSIYWFSTAGPAASLRVYYERAHSWYDQPGGKITRERLAQYVPHVKIGISHFPYDLRVMPKIWAHVLGNVVFQREHDSGGHFAAWERPEALIQDLRDMFGKGGGAYGVVEGKDGYETASSQ